ncbi:MAG: hypothetical protein J2P35_16680 [Actinobacteria bacterium]|nr:hypothetical protein [Actinomycetota bacterium]MBO0787807.1 hypothetical protein [Actinomycetota bacterium]MBO0816901.1 hypothetical protein [Actinomycetota bacterium]
MRRLLFLLFGPLAAALAALVLTAGPASASSPHFAKGPDYTATTTALTATGQAAGLANLPTAAFLTAQTVNVDFHCVNHGNNFAPGHPASFSAVTGPTESISPHNGTIKFDVTLPAPVPSAASVCPNKNWKVIVDEADYLGVVLHIQQNGADILSDGPHDFTSCAAGVGNCVFTG